MPTLTKALLLAILTLTFLTLTFANPVPADVTLTLLPPLARECPQSYLKGKNATDYFSVPTINATYAPGSNQSVWFYFPAGARVTSIQNVTIVGLLETSIIQQEVLYQVYPEVRTPHLPYGIPDSIANATTDSVGQIQVTLPDATVLPPKALYRFALNVELDTGRTNKPKTVDCLVYGKGWFDVLLAGKTGKSTKSRS
ncbi:hypothetical protein HDV00_011853 [Rhizophlyctis rosea]|nr:hypothetical protein HDV00_011853 [Rhizophlyctis rosea]